MSGFDETQPSAGISLSLISRRRRRLNSRLPFSSRAEDRSAASLLTWLQPRRARRCANQMCHVLPQY